MGKTVKCYNVENLNNVDTTRYIEGDIFITNRSVGILANGSIKTFSTGTPNLKNYVKKSEVKKMINEAHEKTDKNE